MLVHNQIKQSIAFEHGRETFKFAPHGACDVPEEAFEHMKLQRFPVAVSPVPPQEKAAAVVDEQRQAARSDEVVLLKADLDKTKAELQSATEAATASEKRREELAAELQASGKALLEETARADRIEGDRKAAEEMLSETARKLESAETEATKLRALLDQQQAPQKSVAPPKK